MVNQFVVDDVVYFIISDSTVEVLAYNGSAASVTIPEQANGYTVVRVGDGAFEGNATLTTVDLPDSIQSIGSRAFANCPMLRDVK